MLQITSGSVLRPLFVAIFIDLNLNGLTYIHLVETLKNLKWKSNHLETCKINGFIQNEDAQKANWCYTNSFNLQIIFKQ